MTKSNCFCITALHNWLKIFSPLFHLIRGKEKTSCDSFTHVFPRFGSVTCNYVEIWLVHCILYVLCDWLDWLLWFPFYDTQLKSALKPLGGIKRIKGKVCIWYGGHHNHVWVNPLTPVPPVTSLGLSSAPDVITFDQNWHHLYSTFADFDFCACLGQNVLNVIPVARMASCRVANAFSTRLKLTWPRSSLKTT